MKTTLFSLSCAIALLSSGCLVERTYDDVNSDRLQFNDVFASSFESNLPLRNATLAGDLGAVRGLDGVANASGFTDSTYASVESIGSNQSGSGMTIINFIGGIDHADLQVGSSVRSTMDDYSDGDLHVEAIGCSGAEIYNWDFDQPADEVDVDVVEGSVEGARVINYTARWFERDTFTGAPTGNSQTVVGSFELMPTR